MKKKGPVGTPPPPEPAAAVAAVVAAAPATRSHYAVTGHLYPQFERVTLSDELPVDLRTEITSEVRTFLDARYRNYTKDGKYAKVQGYSVNPFLLLALAPMYNVNSPYEVAQHIQITKSTHGDSTAWGRLSEERLLARFGWIKPAQKQDATLLPNGMRRNVAWENVDQEHVLDVRHCVTNAVSQRRVLLSLKSGPATIKQGDKTAMVAHFPVAQGDAGADALVVLGVTYGRYERSNKKPEAIITELGAPGWFDYMAGKDFWEFATGIGDFHIKVFAAIREAQRAFADQHADETFYEELVKARLQIASTFREQFLAGAKLDKGEDFWDALFRTAF